MQPFADHLHLQRIREALWQNPRFARASVMVGAGLSLNAKPLSPHVPVFPTWSQLGRTLVDRLYPAKASDHSRACSEANSTSGALRIAEEFQAAFGRDALESLLLEAIPDNSYEPSHLHSLLLRLPWADVLTTNYDTLLERAAGTVAERRYSVVHNIADIPTATRPRIVKLHGSFPSSRPFIITEEDFRSYPRKFAPFVNLAQQVAMETVMCLLGFSGDDPNFLYWTGWVRDHLAASAPQIYLCGLLELNTAKRNLLNARNVVPVDLSPLFPQDRWPDKAMRYRAAVEWFLLNLENGAPPIHLHWPEIQVAGQTPAVEQLPSLLKNDHPTTLNEPLFVEDVKNSEDGVQLLSIAKLWRHNRELFPGWLVTPAAARSKLWHRTQFWLRMLGDANFASAPAPIRISFLYELNWRLERCLFPMFSEVARQVDAALDGLDAFGEHKLDAEALSHLGGLHLLRKMWGELAAARLRLAREDQDYAAYDRWLERVRRTESEFPDIANFRRYQEILFALSQANIRHALTMTSEWAPTESDPYWRVRRSGLLGELGQIEEAIKEARAALQAIRLRTASATDDVFMLSREGWTLRQIQSLSMARDFLSSGPRRRLGFEGRWQQLAQAKCDPTPEWDWIATRLDAEPPQAQRQSTERIDYRGRMNRTLHYNNNYFEKLSPAYEALRLVEEIGQPPICNNVMMDGGVTKTAAQWLVGSSPEFAAGNLFRIGGGKELSECFTAVRVARLSEHTVERYIEIADTNIRDGLAHLRNVDGKASEQTEPFIRQAQAGLTSLQHLAIRLRDDDYDAELTRIIALHNHAAIPRIHALQESFLGYQKTVLDLAPSAAIARRALELFELPLFGFGNVAHKHLWDEPFMLFDFVADRSVRDLDPNRWAVVIDRLLTAMEGTDDESRQRSTVRVTDAFKAGLLTRREEQRFGTALWSKVDPTSGLPVSTWLYEHALLNLPEAKPGVAEKTLKSRFRRFVLPNIVTKTVLPDGKTQMSMTMGDHGRDLAEIANCSESPYPGDHPKKQYVSWSKTDAKHFLKIFETWWDEEGRSFASDPKMQNPMFGDNGCRERAAQGLRMLARVVLPRVRTERKSMDRCARIVSEIFDSPIGILGPMTSFLAVAPQLASAFANAIRRGMGSIEREQVDNALDAVTNWVIDNQRLTGLPKPPDDLLYELGSLISHRRQPALSRAIISIKLIVDSAPDGITGALHAMTISGLRNLLAETAYGSPVVAEDPRSDIWILVRRLAAALATSMNRVERLRDPVLEDWSRAIADDPLVPIRRVLQEI